LQVGIPIALGVEIDHVTGAQCVKQLGGSWQSLEYL
jgi:hypothetical protein